MAPRGTPRLLYVAPRVPWPLETYSNQVVFRKLVELSKVFAVTFVTGIHSDEQAEALTIVGGLARCAVVGVRAPNTLGLAPRVYWKIANLIGEMWSGVPSGALNLGHKPLQRRLRKMASAGAFDLIQVDYWYMGRGWVEHFAGAKVCCTYDVEHLRVERRVLASTHRSKAASRAGAAVRRAEIPALGAYDRVFTVTREEARHLEASGVSASVLEAWPPGVDLESLSPQVGACEKPHSVLFVGAMNVFANIDSVQYFTASMWPAIRTRFPDAEFTIAGRNPTPAVTALRAVPGVHVTGTVVDLAPAYAGNQVVVVPMRAGTGLKGKVLEAMAMCRPIVLTPNAAEGIAGVDGIHFLVAETPAQFVDAVTLLFADSALRQQLGRAARELVAAEYSMDRQVASYAQALLEIARADTR